jgi:RsiW-degrading membrane proteinase PrsW (M82 family)
MPACPFRSPGAGLARLLLTAFVLLGAAGCKHHLVGLHDVVLRYAVARDPASVAPGDADLRRGIARRLGAADVSADVTVDKAGQVVVRVDADLVAETRRLLAWQGGVSAAVVDTAASRAMPSDAPDPPGHRLAVELDPDDAPKATRPARLPDNTRTRALEWPPIVDIDTTGAVADGPRVLIPITETARAALAEAAKTTRDEPVRIGIVHGRVVLAILTAPFGEGGRLVVPLGTGIVAYTEAGDLARVLATPRLPVLTEVSSRDAPSDWTLAGGNLLLPFVVSFAWLFFVRRFDRAQPEPMWLVVVTFALGALATVPAGLVEWGWDSLSPYTNASLLTFGRAPRAFPVALVGFVVTVGLTEEGAKLLATWSLARHRREFDEPVDGIVYAASAALGFAAAENLRYLAVGRVAGVLVASRAFISVPAHLFFSTMWGFALGQKLVHPKKPAWPLFLLAAFCHGAFDACLATDGGLPWAMLVGLFVASVFIVELRLALRHGAVEPTAPGPSARGVPTGELFRMGSRPAFAFSVVSVYALAAATFALTLARPPGRWSLVTIAASALVLALLGWAARGVASTLPLDAVVDERGVTFAGAAIRYADIVRVDRRRVRGSWRRLEQLVLEGSGRRLVVGPADERTLHALEGAVTARARRS